MGVSALHAGPGPPQPRNAYSGQQNLFPSQVVEYVTKLLESIVTVTESFGPQQWGIISIMTILVGYVCLRGTSVR